MKGFLPSLIDATHYWGKLPKVVLLLDGKWNEFTPKFEPQLKKFETYNCTGFNTLNALEILFQARGLSFNFSDRWLGIIAGTKPPGNDPHKICEAIREHGLIPEEMLPFSEDLNSIEEYYSFKGANEAECRKVGQQWKKDWDFKHEWISRKDMEEYLKCSPLNVSVVAWKSEGGLFTKQKGEPDNHWTTCVASEDYWLIADSYLFDDSPFKRLAPDYTFGSIKRYYIVPRTQENWVVDLFKRLFS